MNEPIQTSADSPHGDASPQRSPAIAQPSHVDRGENEPFAPREPDALEETGLTAGEIESLVLKCLLECGSASGRKIADQIKLPFGLTKGILQSLKLQLLVVYKSSAPMSDYEYGLDQAGLDRARRLAERCTYCGAAPVSLEQYSQSVRRQSLRNLRPRFDDFFNAYGDLSVTPSLVSQIGQAVNANRSLLLYGPAGNGKSSVARRVLRGIDQPIWIPRTLSMSGEIIRLYDASYHEAIPLKSDGPLLGADGIDRRWVRIKRPTIVLGAELTLDHLEFTRNQATGIIESSLQMKSNGGAFVIDDFGRQAAEAAELLNRWVVPLESSFDYLVLPSGRQLQVPFDQLLVFATNLDPGRLFDEALLRRIPYKIELPDPTESQFCELFQSEAQRMGFDYSEQAVGQLLDNHFKAKGRPLRYYLVGELLAQVKCFCEVHDRPLELTAEALDRAVENFFAGL